MKFAHAALRTRVDRSPVLLYRKPSCGFLRTYAIAHPGEGAAGAGGIRHLEPPCAIRTLAIEAAVTTGPVHKPQGRSS